MASITRWTACFSPTRLSFRTRRVNEPSRGLITESTIPIKAKGVDTVSATNHLHIVMASNNDWVVPASLGARRFAAFEVPDRRKGNAEYFGALFAEIDDGGLA